MDASQLAVLVGAICTGLGALIGAFVMAKKASGEVDQKKNQQDFEHEVHLLKTLTERVNQLEQMLYKRDSEHRECERKLGVMEGRIEQLTKDMDHVIRRHDEKNQEQIEMNRKKIRELQEKVGDTEL